MSGGRACRDPEHRGEWRVSCRGGNFSAFNGYHFDPSAYSEVVCLVDRRRWRTKAKYVDGLPDLGVAPGGPVG